MRDSVQSLVRAMHGVVSPFVDVERPVRAVMGMPRFMRDVRQYRRLPGAEPLRQWRLQPVLDQRTPRTPYDPHYVHLGAWALRHIVRAAPELHVDIGSQVSWVTCVAAVTRVVFIDIRPLEGSFENLETRAGSLLAIPFADRSLSSLSSLHVAEHVGLGRYGDPLDPLGTRKAVRELVRVLAAGGRLYFGLPIGRPRVCFNAHRIHDPEEIMEWFASAGAVLEHFAAVDDDGVYHAGARPRGFRSCRYGCGMYLFRRT